MKLKRIWLLRITGGIGIFIIVYSLIRHFTGFTINDYFGESAEKTMFDTIVFIALGLFLYNRKMSSDERKEREAKEKAEAAEAALSGETAESGETEAEQEGAGSGAPETGEGSQDEQP
jgi:hypothetical protein